MPAGEGWFVLNAREARWRHREGRGERLAFEGDTEFPQVGVSLYVLGPGEPMGMYPVEEAALRHGAGVEEETNDADRAYARFPEPETARYSEGWLPGLS